MNKKERQEYMKKWQKEHPGYQKRWYEKHKKHCLDYSLDYYKKNKGQCDLRRRNYAKKYPERDKATDAVKRALKRGKLIKPKRCSECDKKKKVVGHHKDYSKWLDVTWLCNSCHKKIHLKLKASA